MEWLVFSALALLIIVVLSLAGFLAFYLGKFHQQAKHTADISSFAVLAGFFATAKAESLKNSTVIQRIVEKYNVVKDPELSKKAEELEKELLDAVDDMAGTYAQIKKKHADLHDFDGVIDPEDTV